jgi:glycosyltransferase involved in cell wall biosynthesis
MKKLMFSGELPPKSIHGVAISNEINLNLLKENFNVFIDEEYVDLTFHGKFHILKFFSFLKRLYRIFNFSIANKFDFFYMVFSTSSFGAIKTLFIIFLFRIFNPSSVCIIHIHRGDLDKFISGNILNRFLFYLVHKLSHKLIVLSEVTKKYLIDVFGDDISVFVLSNTINNEFYLNEIKYVSNDKNKYKFLYLSNYIEEKGILLLLDVFSRLDERFHLSCYGSFSNEKLKEKILSFSSDRVVINNMIYGKDKFLAIKNSDALILPSYNEGKPIVILESIYVGTPFIAPNIGYINEMVWNDYPFIYKKNTEQVLLDMIYEFVNFPEKDMNSLKISLKDFYNNNFSNLKHREKLFKIFTK